MTDGEVVRIAQALQKHNNKMQELLQKLEHHANAGALLDDLHENGFGYAWDIEEICHPHLVHPDRWSIDETGRLVYQAAQAAKGK